MGTKRMIQSEIDELLDLQREHEGLKGLLENIHSEEKMHTYIILRRRLDKIEKRLNEMLNGNEE